jgi:hypothetical protein
MMRLANSEISGRIRELPPRTARHEAKLAVYTDSAPGGAA